MFHRSILSIAVCIITAHEIFGDQRQVKSSIFQINHKKSIHAVSDKFLSFTVDPATLLHVADCELTNATISLIKGLLPAYLRVAGADSNRLLFKGVSDGSTATISKTKNLVLSENQWNKFYEFVSSTGLNLIVCLNGGIFKEQMGRDLSDALEFINFSNKNNFNMNWQLGYELQKISRDDGKVTGQDVAKLSSILKVFPKYQNSLIVGPDVTNFDSVENIRFLRNFLVQAQNSLNAFTIHPNFTAIPDKNLYDALLDLFVKMDTYLWLKEGIFKTTSKGVVPKKPIWIAESEDKDSVCTFLDSISFIKRLGFSAKLGASVFLRKPHLLSLYEPTSEYWAASLFKALVGRSVLDVRLASGNSSSVVVFSHCTQVLEKPEDSIINPTVAYERGSITAYGVNSESEPARLVFKTGIKTDETVHMYVLTEDSRNQIGKTLLNRQYLGLSSENELPMLSPKIRESTESIIVPPHSIFFLVFPNIRCRACMQQPMDNSQEDPKIKTKPTISEEEEYGSAVKVDDIPEMTEEPEDDKAVYVSYPKKSERIKAARNHLPEGSESVQSRLELLAATSIGPKYITFSDDTWLSSFPEKFKEMETPNSDEVPMKLQSKKDKDKHSRIEKYRLLAQAIVGQRNATAKSAPQREESDVVSDEARDTDIGSYRLIRNPRSADLYPSSIISVYQQTRDNSHYAAVPYDQPISAELEESNRIPSQWYRVRRDIQNNLEMPKDNIKNLDKIDIFADDIGKDVVANFTNSSAIEKPSIPKMNSPSIRPELTAESDGIANIRQNREIDGKSVASSSNSAFDSILLEGLNNPTFGPVSPFPRTHPKSAKLKLKSLKSKKVEKRFDSSIGITDNSNPSETDVEASLKQTLSHLTPPAESQPAVSNDLMKTEEPENILSTSAGSTVADTIPANDKGRNANTNKQTASKVRPPLHSAIHKNKASPHFIHPTHQTEAPVRPTRTRSKDVKVRPLPNTPFNEFVRKLKEDASKLQPPLKPNQALELVYAKAQELLNIHKARMEERQRKVKEAAANRAGRNMVHSRSKRETIDPASDFERKISADSDVVGARSHQNEPYRVAPGTSRVPSHRSPGKRLVPHRDTTHRVTTKSPLADRHKAKQHHESRQDKHQLQKRDLMDDLFSEVKSVYEDVSTNVGKNIGPVEKWVENRAEDVKKEFDELRSKRDLEGLKQRIREHRERIRQKWEEVKQNHRIRVRDVHPHPAARFDEKIKSHEKRLRHIADVKRRMEQYHRSVEDKIAALSKPKVRVSEAIAESAQKSRPVRSVLKNELFDHENENSLKELESNDIAALNKPTVLVDKYEPRILKNFSDTLSPPEKKSESREECEGTNFFTKLWCKTFFLFSNFFNY